MPVWVRYSTGHLWDPEMQAWDTVTQSPDPGPGPVWEDREAGLRWDPNTPHNVGTWSTIASTGPDLQSVVPGSGWAGDLITITGTGLMGVASILLPDGSVVLAGSAFWTQTDTQIVFAIPSGVTDTSGDASSAISVLDAGDNVIGNTLPFTLALPA
jgi:hypothetical protein